MITQDKGHHRFNHWNGPRQDTRVVSPAGGEFSGFAGDRDCLLRPEDSRGRFEGHPKKDVLAIADSSLNPSGKIRPGADFAFAHFESVIVFRAGDLTSGKT